MTTQEKYEKMNPSAQAREDWMNKKWRPMMGWMYMIVCIADFIVFPVLWSVIQASSGTGQVKDQWNPLTLQGAGLFHMAMGVVLGLTTWARTQEKLNGVNGIPGMQPNGAIVTTTYGNQSAQSVNAVVTKPVVKPAVKPVIEPVMRPRPDPDD